MQESENETYTIDVDKIIDNYNAANPDLRKMDRKSLAEELNVNKQLFTEWKTKAPKSIVVIMKLLTIGKCSIDDFVNLKS